MIKIKIENKIEIFKIPDRVTCMECMKTYKQITEWHVKKHGLNMKMYRRKYPDAHITCSSTLLNISNEHKKYLKNHPEIIDDFRTKIAQDPEMRKKGSDAAKRPEIKQKQKKRMKLSRNLPYQKRRQREINKERWKNPEYRERISHVMQKKCDKKRKKRKKDMLPEIKRLYDSGLSSYEIAIKIGIHRSSIWRWLVELENKNEISMRKKESIDYTKFLQKGRRAHSDNRKEIKNKKIDEIKKLRKDGLTLKQIEEKTGIGYGTIWNWLNNKTLVESES